MDVTRDMTADEYVKIITDMVNERRISVLPFLDRLERGEITKEQISKVCYQMMFYYNHSVRCIGGALMGHMDRDARTAIMENLIDEETEDRCGYAAHYVIALDFAEACGYSRAEVEAANNDGTLQPHPQLQEALEDLARMGVWNKPEFAMAAGMVGGEGLLPDFYIRLVAGLRKNFAFTDKDLDIFIVHIEGDLEHVEEGRKLVRAYADTPERRQEFYNLCKYARDRVWEAWDGVFRAADVALPQAFYPEREAIHLAAE